MDNTSIKFFGTTACIFDKNDDDPCFLVNNKYLFDTGFAVVNNLVNNDINPTSIKYLFFTHMHHDHYISLPALLFYYLQNGARLDELTILGPSRDVARIVDKAMDFIEAKTCWQTNGPKVVELDCGYSFETEDMLFETVSSVHPVQGLCYRMTDKNTGKVICATGDTTVNDKLPQFFAGCDALIHEISLGMYRNTGGYATSNGHSSVYEAVDLANVTGAKQLFFVHNSRKIEKEVLAYAKGNFKGEKAVWPAVGHTYCI